MNKRAELFVRNSVLLFVVIVPLVATGYAIYALWNQYVTPLDLALLGIMYAFTAMGIGIGFHRMLTHRGFDAPGPVRAFWLIMGSMAWQGPAIEWAATHVKHHAKADTEEDPHSPLEGLFHAHMGWLFRDRMVTEGVYAKPFQQDRLVVFIDRTFWVWAALSLLIPAGIGYAFAGWSGFWGGLLWGGLVRVFLVHHVTWSVNSICHAFGKAPNPTKDTSKNVFIVGVLGFGEGWHNNHHASPRTAVHGWKWWQIDFNAYVIWGMEKLRLVKNVYRKRSVHVIEATSSAKDLAFEAAQAAKEKATLAAAAVSDAAAAAKERASQAVSDAADKAGEAAAAVAEAAGKAADAVTPSPQSDKV
ncbi:MAG TPA: acyl-CoA desaturase [Candidatus Thermoplasmatota archaeon]|nr:acyl-CoA desaturase [Candidatus Thermoplasmatota archaeon]